MGFFGRMKKGISSKANAALDKAIDPAKEIDMAILELEEQRKKALAELVAYKATAKQMENDQLAQEEKAAGWEKRAMTAVKAGDDDSAREALKRKKDCLVEAAKIRRDRDEATGYAVQLNKSRKEFETKLQILKLKRGTLATQLAAARSPGGDAFGHDTSVWDQFARAEERIDAATIETEVDAAMRGEVARDAELEGKILAAGAKAQVAGALTGEDALAALKRRMEEARAEKKALPPAGAELAQTPAQASGSRLQASGARKPGEAGGPKTGSGSGSGSGSGPAASDTADASDAGDRMPGGGGAKPKAGSDAS